MTQIKVCIKSRLIPLIINRILVGHLNINSLRNKSKVFKDIVKDKPDIIMISETKLDNS